jgi:hypothetical protein
MGFGEGGWAASSYLAALLSGALFDTLHRRQVLVASLFAWPCSSHASMHFHS